MKIFSYKKYMETEKLESDYSILEDYDGYPVYEFDEGESPSPEFIGQLSGIFVKESWCITEE